MDYEAKAKALKEEALALGISRYDVRKGSQVADPKMRIKYYQLLIRCYKRGQHHALKQRAQYWMSSRRVNAKGFRNRLSDLMSRKFAIQPLMRRQRLATSMCRGLYVMTSINPFLSVCLNEYTGVRNFRPVIEQRMKGQKRNPYFGQQVYHHLFYFARLKPRLVYVIGACLRALQQTTVIQLVFDPKIGVGAGLNLLAFWTGSSWPAQLVLGWASTAAPWRMLQAEPPPHDINFPITLVGVVRGKGR